MDLLDKLVHFAIGRGQLFDRRTDSQQLAVVAIEILHQFFELAGRPFDHFARLGGQIIDLAGAFLRISDQFSHFGDIGTDLSRGVADLAGQGADFVGNHRKTTAHLARTSRFNRGI